MKSSLYFCTITDKYQWCLCVYVHYLLLKCWFPCPIHHPWLQPHALGLHSPSRGAGRCAEGGKVWFQMKNWHPLCRTASGMWTAVQGECVKWGRERLDLKHWDILKEESCVVHICCNVSIEFPSVRSVLTFLSLTVPPLSLGSLPPLSTS